MGEVTVRRAGADDAFIVAALHLQCAREQGMPPEQGFLDRFVDAWLGERRDRPTWYAEYMGEHAGVLEARRNRALPWPGQPESSWLHVGILFVIPGQRGRGVGSALVRAMTDWARGTDVGRIRLDAATREDRGFFRRFGFVSPDRLMELDLGKPQ